MDCIVIFGPSAVGKYTVARELAARNGYALFHNHQVIELVRPYFGWDDPAFAPLVDTLRHSMLAALRDSAWPGVILTYVWALDDPADTEALLGYLDCLGCTTEEALFVELTADVDERLRRNALPERIAAKPSKANLVESESFIRKVEVQHQLNSCGDFPWPRHAVFDTTRHAPADIARAIVNLQHVHQAHTTEVQA